MFGKWPGYQTAPSAPFPSDSAGKRSERTAKYKSGEVFQRRAQAVEHHPRHHHSQRSDTVQHYQTKQHAIRLRDVETQTDPVLIIPQPTVDFRQLVVDEDKKIRERKETKRMTDALRARKLVAQHKIAAKKQQKVLKAIKSEAIPDEKITKAGIIKPKARHVSATVTSANAEDDLMNSIFGVAGPNVRPPTPGKDVEPSTEDQLLLSEGEDSSDPTSKAVM